MTDKEFEEFEGRLKKDSKWIFDGLRDGSIKFNCNHKTLLKDFINSKAFTKLENFIFEMFSTSINILSITNKMNDLKNGEKEISAFYGECNECGEKIHYSFNGKEFTPKKRIDNKFIDYNCYKNDEKLSFEIEFPTGELIFNDRLDYSKDLFKSLNNHPHSIGSTTGIYERVNNYSSKNILHIYVGNTSPSLWLKDNKLAIGQAYYNEECDGEITNCNCDTIETVIVPFGDSIEIGGICTDLWWASLIDTEVYKNLLIENFGEEDGLNKLSKIEKVKTRIKPGKYRCTYYKKNIDTDEFIKKEPTIYCKLELIK